MPDSLPCGGCIYCERAHLRWTKFEEEVDDTIPLAVRTITPAGASVTQTVPADELLDGLEGLDDDDLTLHLTPQEDLPPEEEITEEFLSFDQPNWVLAYTPEELRRHQLKDASLIPIIGRLEANDWNQAGILQLMSA